MFMAACGEYARSLYFVISGAPISKRDALGGKGITCKIIMELTKEQETGRMMARFIDWNGTGDIDSQDIATSIAFEEVERKDGDGNGTEADSDAMHASNAGCLTVVLPVILLPLLGSVLYL